nr:15401_t:CDS:2 [Entrophospora candida]
MFIMVSPKEQKFFSNNEDKNDAAETRVSRKKRRLESVINEFDDSSNIDKNKRSGMEMERWKDDFLCSRVF